MKACTYASVVQQIAALAGEDYDTLATLDRTHLNRTVNRRLHEAWLRDWWPDFMLSEQRYWRDTWAAQAYAEAAQVWHAGSEAYFEANAATISTDVPGVSAKWDEITEIDPYISRTQAGQTVIGLVRGVYDDDPEFTDTPRARAWRLGANGIHLLGDSVPVCAWVWFMENPPDFTGADWAAGSAYATGARRYYSAATVGFEGDYYTAAAATTAGQSPETHPEKWPVVPFPQAFRPFVVQGAYADWLRADGQTDKALVEQQLADDLLGTAQLQALRGTPPLRYRLA